MKVCLLLFSLFVLLQCQPDSNSAFTTPCQENTVPSEWNCEERINYNFCFPPSYASLTYLWIKDEPYSHMSKGIFEGANIMDIDNSNFVEMPFPDQISLTENNVLTEKIEICNDNDIIGVFYFGKVILDEMHDYVGSLYLKTGEDQQKYYLSAHSDMTKEGISDILAVVRRIKKI